MKIKFSSTIIKRIIISIYLLLIIIILDIIFLFTKKSKNSNKNILIIKLDAIGDYILFRNFIEIINKSSKFKDYKITYLGNQNVKSISEWLDGEFIDKYIWINTKKILKNPLYLFKIASEIKNNYQYAIQPTYSRTLIGNYLIKTSKAKHRISFKGDSNNILPIIKKVTDGWYNNLIKINQKTIFEFEKNKELFKNIINAKINLTSPLIKKEKLQNSDTPLNFKNISNYIVIFPGASNYLKMWSTTYYAKIVKYISEKYNYTIVICGSVKENILANEIINLSKNKAIIDLTGKTDLKQLTLIINNAKLLITNDTSAAHIGPAVNVNTIALSQMHYYGRFLPYPAHYSSSTICVIPHKFSNLTFNQLTEKFKNGSNIDINLIRCEDVKKKVDLLLSK